MGNELQKPFVRPLLARPAICKIMLTFYRKQWDSADHKKKTLL
jgi:hypothetical protein